MHKLKVTPDAVFLDDKELKTLTGLTIHMGRTTTAKVNMDADVEFEGDIGSLDVTTTDANENAGNSSELRRIAYELRRQKKELSKAREEEKSRERAREAGERTSSRKREKLLKIAIASQFAMVVAQLITLKRNG